MKVVLMQDIKDLGKKGELVNVADGYGKNYLIPRKLAVLADNTAMNELKNRETDTELFLYADEAAYPILIREEHTSTLKKVLATLSDKTLAIAKGAPQADRFDEDVQKLKNAFGADFVTIK